MTEEAVELFVANRHVDRLQHLRRLVVLDERDDVQPVQPHRPLAFATRSYAGFGRLRTGSTSLARRWCRFGRRDRRAWRRAPGCRRRLWRRLRFRCGRIRRCSTRLRRRLGFSRGRDCSRESWPSTTMASRPSCRRRNAASMVSDSPSIIFQGAVTGVCGSRCFRVGRIGAGSCGTPALPHCPGPQEAGRIQIRRRPGPDGSGPRSDTWPSPHRASRAKAKHRKVRSTPSEPTEPAAANGRDRRQR